MDNKTIYYCKKVGCYELDPSGLVCGSLPGSWEQFNGHLGLVQP